jgi:hypothetical protein
MFLIDNDASDGHIREKVSIGLHIEAFLGFCTALIQAFRLPFKSHTPQFSACLRPKSQLHSCLRMEGQPMLPPEEFQKFSRKSPAYVLWFHATAVQRGWNTLRILRDGVIEDALAAVVTMGSRQWRADADLEAATRATRDTVFGYAASGGEASMKVLGEHHPLSKGFAQIRMSWEETKLQHPEDIQNLVFRLLAIGEEMKMAVDQLELVSRACLASTRLLHLSSSELAEGNAIPALEEDRALLEAYMNRHLTRRRKASLTPIL